MENIVLLDEYKEMHEKGFFQGFSILDHVGDIKDLVEAYNPTGLLDYGCGQGLQYSQRRVHEYWGGLMPHLYDPASKHHNKLPAFPVDGVICTDVAEHVPEEELEDFLKEIFRYAKKFVFMTVCTRPAKKTLPNGMNAHVTVKDEDWWLKKINEAHEDKKIYLKVNFVV